VKRAPYRTPIVGLLLAAGLPLTACADEAKQTTSAAATPSPTATATTVTATLTDFKISLSSAEFAAGTYSFLVKEAGTKPHALAISGPGVEKATSAVIQPGGADQTLMVSLQPGVYHLWCPVGKHADKGMEMMITVK
jgi:plastocyanin